MSWLWRSCHVGLLGANMPPLPLLVASPSPGAAFDHAQLVSKRAAGGAAFSDAPPKLEKFSELKREATEASELAARLQAENDRLQAENEALAQENRELKAARADADDSHTRGKPAEQEIKELKRQLSSVSS